ncbi:MAG: hypothetical protein AAB225_05465 [Acidobacteriota bacterium]
MGKSSRILLATVAVIAAAVALGIVGHLRRQAQEADALAKIEAERDQLRSRAGQLARENEALRRDLGMPPPVEPAPAVGRPRKAEVPSPLEHVRMLAKVQAELAAANNSIAELQARINELEASLARTNDENKRLAAAAAELQEKLAGHTRVVEALQAELKTRSERLVQLETTNTVLHREHREQAQKGAQVAGLLRELEEMNRRREQYLASILRRYREVTDRFRTLAVRADSPPESRVVDPSEFSRLQSAVASAEEDLRQIGSLNAQAARLQQKLAGK